MNFDAAFLKLLGHEGGYVNHPAVEYVNDTQIKSHSRIPASHAPCLGVGGCNAVAEGVIDLCGTRQLTSVRLHRSGLPAAGVCGAVVQRALHPASQRRGHVSARKGQEARWSVLDLRKGEREQGRLGHVSDALSASQIRGAEGRGCEGVRRQVHVLRRGVPPCRLRLSSLRRQRRLSELHVSEHIAQDVGRRAFKVQVAVRELSPAGALR